MDRNPYERAAYADPETLTEFTRARAGVLPGEQDDGGRRKRDERQPEGDQDVAGGRVPRAGLVDPHTARRRELGHRTRRGLGEARWRARDRDADEQGPLGGGLVLRISEAEPVRHHD